MIRYPFIDSDVWTEIYVNLGVKAIKNKPKTGGYLVFEGLRNVLLAIPVFVYTGKLRIRQPGPLSNESRNVWHAFSFSLSLHYWFKSVATRL